MDWSYISKYRPIVVTALWLQSDVYDTSVSWKSQQEVYVEKMKDQDLD